MLIKPDNDIIPVAMDDFYRLQLSQIIIFLRNQQLSFWFILLYLIFEYLQPHVMYPAFNVIPWVRIILILCLVAVFFEQRRLKIKSPVNKYINFLFIVIFISSLNAMSSQVAFDNIKVVIVLLLIYYLMINIIDNMKKFFIFLSLFLLLGFKFSQFIFLRWVARGFSYDRYGSFAGNGWLENPGEMAIHMCIIFVLSLFFIRAIWPQVESRILRYLLVCIPLTAAGSVIACGSRGSYLALTIAFGLIVFCMYKKMIGFVILTICILIVPYFLSTRDINRLQSMGSVYDTTAMNRLERWEKGWEMIKINPVLGVGYDNWAEADERYFDGEGKECHNIFIECGSELGFLGLFAFALLLISNVKTNFETIVLARESGDWFACNMAQGLNICLVAYLVAGMFVTVFYYPYFWINLAMSVSLNIGTKKALS
jgi:O-antigen ligase